MLLEEEQNPIELFKELFDKVQELDVHEPSAMTLATSTKDGVPSARIMLLKGYDERGFCFYTNLTGRKGKELLYNPHASLCFYWDKIDIQVRIEGKVEKVTEHESDAYFITRSRESQIGAWASKQSNVMKNEDDLPKRVDDITKQFENQDVPRPPFWSGFRVVPQTIEFWEKRPHRLHKRILYTKNQDGWDIDILYP